MIRSMRFLWRWSWMITLPVTLGFFHWGLATAERYRDFGVRLDVNLEPFRLWNLGHMEFDHMLRQLSRIAWPPRNTEGARELETINLFVAERDLARLDSRLPDSGFEYVQGGLWDDGKVREVELRYRGDNVYHWGYYKKSWRVKTKRGSLFMGMRRFNILAPKTAEMLNNYLSYRLASVLGLVAPQVEMVNLAVNGRPVGIHVLTEQLSELTLRRHGLMPGDLYSGELYGPDRSYGPGVTSRVFRHPGLWTKTAANNHYDEASIAPLQRLIEVLAGPRTEAGQAELTDLVDIDAFGRFGALEVLLSTLHFDSTHNWRLYFDPWRRKFVPLVWDPVGWHPDFLPRDGGSARLDVVRTRLHLALHANGEYLRARHAAVREFFSSGRDESFLAVVDGVVRTLHAAVEEDPNLTAHVKVLTPDEVGRAMAGLQRRIRRVFGEIRDGYLGGVAEMLYGVGSDGVSLAFEVSGRRPVERVELRYARVLENPVSAAIRFWRDGEVAERDVSGALLRSGARLELRTPLLARWSCGGVGDPPEVLPGYYELELRGIDRDAQLLEVLADRGDGGLERARKVDELRRSSFDGMFAVVRDQPVREPVLMQGDVAVDGILRLDDEVILRPGTTLRMEPGASVILRGRLWAQGTAEQPVRIIAARDGQAPWGTFALQGPGAAGSVLSHCEVVGGSGLKGDLFEYSAMFSIHDVDGVTVEHCRFEDNAVVDDMVHAVYSRVRFSDCEFKRSLFDALDLDITEGLVERCAFRESGNDALDLMTSKVVVLDSVLQGNGDKGISVGENTRLLAIGCKIQDNAIGVESKDRSVAVLYNAELSGNDVALNSYDKNWQYEGGGLTYLYKGRLFGNREMIVAQKGSRTWVYDTWLDRPLDPGIKRVEVHETVDTDRDRAARIRALWRFDEERERLGEFAERYWSAANPTIRGVTDVDR